VIAWKRGETEYWISWIPLGGYVKMAGLEEEGMVGELEGGKADAAIDPARSFDRQPIAARMAVILAGVSMNVLLAFVIYAGLAAVAGVSRFAMTPVDSIQAGRLPAWAQPLLTLHRGDRITHVGDDSLRTWDDLEERIEKAPDELRLRVAERAEPLVMHLPSGDTAARHELLRAIVPLFPARIGPVAPGQPAHRAGLRGGDVVVRINDDTIASWLDMVARIREQPGHPVTLVVLRRDSLIRFTVVPETIDSGGKRYGFIGAGANPPTVRDRVGLGAAIVHGGRQTLAQIVNVVTSVKRIVAGEASTRELGGPIAIAQMSGQAVRLGLDWFLNFLAFFSVSLAVLNLLPIPVLDGGHALFLIVEAVRRKPLTPTLRMRLTQLGMLVVLGIMVLAISNDVLRLFR